MASVLTLFYNNPMQSGSSAGVLDLSQPTASTSTTGWTVGTLSPTLYSRMSFANKLTSTAFHSTPVELGGAPSATAGLLAADCWRLSAATSGTFSAGTWYSALSCLATTTGGSQDGNGRWRLWRSSSVCTNESGATFNFEIGGVNYGSGGSLSAVSANMGLYTCIFSASKLSVPGVGQVMYSSGTALPVSAPFVVTLPMLNRLVSIATCSSGGANTITLDSLETNTADQLSGMCITVQYRDGTYQDNVIQKYSAARVATVYNSWASVPVSGMTYWLQPGGAQAWSTSTVSGIAAGTYSGAPVGAANFAPGVYSRVSVSVRDSGIAPTSFQLANYSGVSVEVKSGGIQTSSVGVGNYSGVSVEITTKGIGTNSITSGTYSGVTLGANPVGDKTLYSINSIVPGSYSGVSVEVKTGGIQTASVGKGAYSGVSLEVTTGGIQVASVDRKSTRLN